ncbi:hypothetical protein [Chryseobacterium caseinilyticum]|uniref:Uncharacterized protein n=1 Tax=Chryseobacterium caseinilyticum TaxID=2771428 RepID=A0ABR8ZCN2_9FLAO|nr:hypothetical protein [Chryseobacterium caseinilyticum]MBD8083011.1 hypothetical protein [Chryseobacterium caseinilyticum]
MKTLNDSLRDEFLEILNNDFQNKIEEDSLDIEVLKKAFDVLLRFKLDSDLTDKGRGEFENFLINYLKTIKN